ncbi:MAG: glycosyltransferase [Sulfuricaulis sp.]|uniref:glycosyltransferase n=1 Tax=Sulfuricaulis sp. TaxID=2003553 RepID=UPI003C4AB0BE
MFVNRRFEGGGAERQLIELTKNLDKSRFHICVATFYEGGALYSLIRAVPDVHLANLHKQGRWDTIRFLRRFWRAVREFRPQIMVGYMTVANLLTLAVGKLCGAKVVWAIRNSIVDMGRYDWLARITLRLECLLSHWADLVIFNSHAGRDHYVKCGFPETSSVVISNGIDVEYFKADRESRRRVRLEWGVGEKNPLIGMVARLDPMKDHDMFLAAAAALAKERDDVRFVCVGDGASTRRVELVALAEQLGLGRRIIWVNGRDDMPAVYSALDVMSLPSHGEGFPNVVGEAMACGVPCVVTDVGDAAVLVGDIGLVVPPRDSAQLTEKWKEMLEQVDKQREAMSELARRRIVEDFSTKALSARTELVLKGLID